MRKIVVIGGPIRPLYLQIEISLGSSLIGAFKKLASFTVYWVLIKARAFALESAKVEVKT